MIEIPLLGELEKDQLNGWLRSKPISVNVLAGDLFAFALEGYEEDDALFSDEIDVVNSDRLILIKLYTSLIKLSTDSLAKK